MERLCLTGFPIREIQEQRKRPTLDPMINQRHCPFCRIPAARECSHLALAVEGRDFVKRCIDLCHGEIPWRLVCQHRQLNGWSVQQEDFTWLESAFCAEFLKHLQWYGGMDYEWRTGSRLEQGGFWVLLWSKEPRRLWWELRDEFERQTMPVYLERRPLLGEAWLLKA